MYCDLSNSNFCRMSIPEENTKVFIIKLSEVGVNKYGIVVFGSNILQNGHVSLTKHEKTVAP